MTTAPTLNETAAVERHNGAAPALPTVTGGASSALALMTDFASTVRQVEAFVNALVDTPFVPESHWPLPVGVQAKEMPNRNPRLRHARETEENWSIRRQIACASGTGSVLTGLPLGLDPLVALAQVFVVKGRPGLYTKIKLALAQARGHDAWDVERSDERVTCGGRRRGWPQDRYVEITVTMADAVRAGWTSNETYDKTPADMLWSRAMSRVLDRIAADVLFGIASIEDLEVDDAPLPADRPSVGAAVDAVMDAPRPGSERLRSLLGEQTPRQPHEEDITDAELREHEAALQRAVAEHAANTEPSPPIEQTDWRRLMARFNELGVNGLGRDVRRLQVMSRIVGREIAKGSELSKADAQLILDNLAGTGGARLVAEVEDVVDPAVVDQDEAADADPASDADAEPTADEGRPAALEGVADPWGPQ